MKVLVHATARLHMGFYNFLADGIAYGSIGVALDRPSITVRVFTHSEGGFKVLNRAGVDITDCIRAVEKVFDLRGIGIEVVSAIPRHVGLGSTTQTVLAIAYALSKLQGLGYGVRGIAVKLCRGRDSGVGIAAFESGGFVVDSGRRVTEGRVACPSSVEDLPQPVFQAPLPKKWSFLIFTPKKKRGLDEVSERRALDTPIELPRDTQFELYKLVFLHMIPSVLRRDAETFGKALTKLQFIVGEYFSKYQGGVFCCEEAETIVKTMLRHGVKGVGQSSWGPTVYGLVEGHTTAKRLCEKVLRDLRSEGVEVEYMIAKARNKGAEVAVER
uniref:Beta-ribofuranosylaminobenzene 5'-phosphate synthase n=1 Tax=Ignisphaera aggregans TaxID=334771 RepID=A0A7C4BDF1_9CREN